MRTGDLQAEHVDGARERALLATWAQDPDLFWGAGEELPAEVFAVHRDDFQRVTAAIAAGTAVEVPSDWSPSKDPETDVSRLESLLVRRRAINDLLAPIAKAVANQELSAAEIGELVTKAVQRFDAARKEGSAGRLKWGDEILDAVLDDAQARARQYQETRRPCIGLETGIIQLDRLLGGLEKGLYVLGGPPGMGKTSLALQIAARVAPQAPVVYATFENSPANLVQKLLASKAGHNSQDIKKGVANQERLESAAVDLRETLRRFAFVDGTSRFTLAQLRGQARRAILKHRAERCLVIVDYLQLAGKGGEFRSLGTVRERVEAFTSELVSLSVELDSPVLALSSVNREQGNYGAGGGSPRLDALKESGDIEFAADAVFLLTQDMERIETPPTRALTLNVKKNRHGDIGKIELRFRPDRSLFMEVDLR